MMLTKQGNGKPFPAIPLMRGLQPAVEAPPKKYKFVQYKAKLQFNDEL